jgi:ATP-dependent Clp protease ATP-binding subunit ClpC
LRRAIQRFIEDPLADFVLRAELEPGATVLVERAPEGEEPEVKISVIKGVPVGVGAEGDEPDADHSGDDADSSESSDAV